MGAPPQQVALETGQHAAVELKLTALAVNRRRVLDEDGEPLSQSPSDALDLCLGQKAIGAGLWRYEHDDRDGHRIFDISRAGISSWHRIPPPPGAASAAASGKKRTIIPGQHAPGYYPNGRDPAQASAVEVTPWSSVTWRFASRLR